MNADTSVTAGEFMSKVNVTNIDFIWSEDRGGGADTEPGQELVGPECW